MIEVNNKVPVLKIRFREEWSTEWIRLSIILRECPAGEALPDIDFIRWMNTASHQVHRHYHARIGQTGTAPLLLPQLRPVVTGTASWQLNKIDGQILVLKR